MQLFANGLGPVNNTPASGDPAPADLTGNSTRTLPEVTIGGQQAAVKYSGLAATVVSVYQINAVVPNTGPGIQSIQVSIGGIQSSVSHIAVQ